MAYLQRAPSQATTGRVGRWVASLGLAIIAACGCAVGADLEEESGSYLSLDAGPDGASNGGRGSGGAGNGGYSWNGGAANGGAASGGAGKGAASGGAPGDGGRSSGDGGASRGGARAAGGAPGDGGRSSGGTPAAGGAQTSGGRSSGGAPAAGGAPTSGGVTAAGGASACPNYPTDDECSRCICSRCASQVSACYSSSDSTKNEQCARIQDCAEAQHCASDPCYCGDNCFAPNGACKSVIESVAGTNPLDVARAGGDTSHPLGRANQIGICTQANCASACGL